MQDYDQDSNLRLHDSNLLKLFFSETAQLVEVTQKQLILVVAMMSVICFLFILLCSCAVMMYRRQNTAHSFDHDKQFSPYGNYGNGAHTLMSAYPASYMSGNSSPPMMIGPGQFQVSSPSIFFSFEDFCETVSYQIPPEKWNPLNSLLFLYQSCESNF